MIHANRAAAGRGFTLLEVLLAMALAAIVLGAVTMAIDFHLRVVESGRKEVEEAQLARALLRKIADDLRCAVRYEPMDVSSIEGLTASSSSSSSSRGNAGTAGTAQSASSASALTGTSGTSGNSSSSTDPASATGEETDLAAAPVWGATPGLYGNHYEIQVDVSRLPRIDQYEQLMVDLDGRPGDLVSDVKTVAYYLGTSPDASIMGLRRRELDRAATSFASQSGGVMELEQYQTLLAPEVLAIEFNYYDGIDWYPDWDSSVSGGLPIAVEIAVAISMTPGAVQTAGLIDLSMVTGEEDFHVYRLLVHLPASKSAADQMADSATDPTATGTSTSSSSSTSTGTTP
jgi:prepilin-type N-terminal cleavage/methylation domain-containing protein